VKILKLFFEKWDPYFHLEVKDINNNYEKRYYELITIVQEEINLNKTISKETFEEIYKWKTRNRSKHWIEKKVRDYDKFVNTFQKDITNVLAVDESEKIKILLRTGIKRPIASTYLHFIYNHLSYEEIGVQGYPIIDVNTIDTLWDKFGLLKEFQSKNWILSHAEGYNEYRALILKINDEYKDIDLREIDRALFNYNIKKIEFLRLINKNAKLNTSEILDRLNIKKTLLIELIDDSIETLIEDLKIVEEKEVKLLKKKEEIKRDIKIIQNL